MPVLNKIFDRAIYLRLIHVIADNSILNPAKFGFTNNKSTQDAIINLTECIYNSLNCKEISLNVFINYQKVFDTINHGILLRKLEVYGITLQVEFIHSVKYSFQCNLFITPSGIYS